MAKRRSFSQVLFLCLLLLRSRNASAWIFPSPSVHYQPSRSSVILMGLRGKRIRREKRKAMREPTPPRIETPYGPVRVNRPPRVCDTCRGRGVIRCPVCEGRGVIRATGQRKSNQVKPNQLVSSQWTSVEVYNGHRHHTIMETRGSLKKGNLEARMRNCCGESHDFWISVKELKNKSVWRKGWQTLQDIQRADGGPLLDVRYCFRCKGERILKCIDCDGQGEIPSYEPLHE